MRLKSFHKIYWREIITNSSRKIKIRNDVEIDQTRINLRSLETLFNERAGF